MLSTTNNDISVFQLPSCSEPVRFQHRNIPPPLPLQWQIAIPSDLDAEWYTTRPRRPQCFEPFQIETLPSIVPMMTKHKTQPTLGGDEDIINVLRRFGDCADYRESNTIVVNAFIESIQQSIDAIIPRDINAICLSFYFVREHHLIHLAYRVYKITQESSHDENTIFSGKELVSMMNDNHLLKDFTSNCTDSTGTVCTDLMEFSLIELHSFKAYFSSLFDESSSLNRHCFKACANYSYCFANGILNIFKAFSLSAQLQQIDAIQS